MTVPASSTQTYSTPLANCRSWVTTTCVTPVASKRLEHLVFHRRVERAGGLVVEQHPRFHREGAGDGNALFLTP